MMTSSRPPSPVKTSTRFGHRTTASGSLLPTVPTGSATLKHSPTFGSFKFDGAGKVSNTASAGGGGSDFEEVQHRAFLKWLNARLATQGLAPLTDLRRDFNNGCRLIELIEVLTGEDLGKRNAFASHPSQKGENLNLAIKAIKSAGVKLTNIGPEDIMDGNLKLILGLIWSLVQRFVIAGINEEGANAKAGLLLWCQRNTAGYDGIDIRDFQRSWGDGLGFCALIHKHRPDLIDYEALVQSDAEHNMRLAFETAERELGIPQILEVKDLAGNPTPDEMSVMTYLAQYFHCFSRKVREDSDSRTITNFVNSTEEVLSAANDYARRAKAFLDSLVLPATTSGTAYEQLQSQLVDLKTWETSAERQSLRAEPDELDALLHRLGVKLEGLGFAAYTPPDHLALGVLDEAWTSFLQSELKWSQQIFGALAVLRSATRERFVLSSRTLSAALKEAKVRLSKIIDPQLESQIEVLNRLAGDVMPSMFDQLSVLEEVEKLCSEREVRREDYRLDWAGEVLDASSARRQVEKLDASFRARHNFLENQMTIRKQSNVTAEQTEEYDTTFRQFDEKGINRLNFAECCGALGALGFEGSSHNLIFEGMLGEEGEEGGVNYERFVKFLVEKTQDLLSLDKVRESFRNLASGKSYLRDLDITRAELEPSVNKFLKKHLTPLEPEDLDSHEENGVDAGAAYSYEELLGGLFKPVSDDVFHGARGPRRSLA